MVNRLFFDRTSFRAAISEWSSEVQRQSESLVVSRLPVEAPFDFEGDSAKMLLATRQGNTSLDASRMDDSMNERLTFDQLQEGQSWTSPSRTITETDVVNFANTTGDMNPLHVDHEFARETHYRQPVAHGLLGLSWVAGLGSNSPAVDTVAFASIREWHFSKPLYFGDTVHVVTEVTEKQSDAKRVGRVTWKMQLINQRDEVTQVGNFETLVRVAKPAPKQAAPAPHFLSKKSESKPSE